MDAPKAEKNRRKPKSEKQFGIDLPGPVEMIPVAKLLPSAQNPRFHSDTNVEKIAQSIKTYGWTTPVLISDKGELIAGHGRLLAAAKVGMTAVPCIKLIHLTPALVEAYRIADNRLALDSEWDEELLHNALKSLQDQNFDLSLTGFDPIELASRLEESMSSAHQEWNGMPEFDQPDINSFRKIVVHFADQGAVDDFTKRMEAKITDQTKFIWHPAIERNDLQSMRYADEDES